MSTLSISFARRAAAPASRLIAPAMGAKLSGSIIMRHLSSPPKKCAVINTVGPDRPGIVADVTRMVTERGGNVGESHSQLLGGHFALMMLVENLSPSDVEGLRDELRGGVGGMETSCFEAIDPKGEEMTPRIGFAGQFKLSGADNPGIVHKLTSVLARNSLTIGSMKTSQEEAPFGGTELFTMEGRAVAYEPLASNFDWRRIGEELRELGDGMNCDVEFDDVTAGGSAANERAA